MIAQVLLLAGGFYLLCGLIFAIPFVWIGVGRIDPHAAHGSWGFRVLIIPGAMFFWPLLARRWMQGMHEPPEERNAHRYAARRKADFPVGGLTKFSSSVCSSGMKNKPGTGKSPEAAGWKARATAPRQEAQL